MAEQLYDCEGITLESNKPFAFSCCDCGLTHHMVIVSEDGKPVGFAVKRIPGAPPAPTVPSERERAACIVEDLMPKNERSDWTEWARIRAEVLTEAAARIRDNRVAGVPPTDKPVTEA